MRIPPHVSTLFSPEGCHKCKRIYLHSHLVLFFWPTTVRVYLNLTSIPRRNCSLCLSFDRREENDEMKQNKNWTQRNTSQLQRHRFVFPRQIEINNVLPSFLPIATTPSAQIVYCTLVLVSPAPITRSRVECILQTTEGVRYRLKGSVIGKRGTSSHLEVRFRLRIPNPRRHHDVITSSCMTSWA